MKNRNNRSEIMINQKGIGINYIKENIVVCCALDFVL